MGGRVVTHGSLPSRLSSGVEILYAAPSEQHAWSWHRALSGTAGRYQGKPGVGLGARIP